MTAGFRHNPTFKIIRGGICLKLKEKYNIPLFLAAFALVVFFVILLLLFPTQMNNGISAAFNWCTY